MATPHLTSRAKIGDETINPLLAITRNSASHLLIVKRNSVWSSKTFVVTPEEERYACAVTYGRSSSYNTEHEVTDLTAMATRHRNLWAAMDETAWHTGHKPGLVYCARGYGPWYLRAASASDISSYAARIVEYGGCRQDLVFNCHGVPVKLGSDNTASMAAYLRFWNPSNVFAYVQTDQWADYEQARYSNTDTTHTICYGWSHQLNLNNFCNVCYHIRNAADTTWTPNAIANADAGAVNFAEFANEGRYGTSGDGLMVHCLRYDVWNNHHATANSSSTIKDAQKYCRIGIYAQGGTGSASNTFSVNPYYADHQITGTQLTRLKTALAESGKVQIAIGPNTYPPTATNQGVRPSCTQTVYFSRVDLILTISGAKVT